MGIRVMGRIRRDTVTGSASSKEARQRGGLDMQMVKLRVEEFGQAGSCRVKS